MFKSNTDVVNQVMNRVNPVLDRFTAHIRNQAIKAGVTAAAVPLQQVMAALASRYRSDDPTPTRTIRGTGIKVSRPHFADSINKKVWRIPGGNGYIAIVGPTAVEIPHAHFFGDTAPTDRYTKLGQYRGTHLGGTGPKAKGTGPAMILSQTWNLALPEATQAMENVIREKIETFQA